MRSPPPPPLHSNPGLGDVTLVHLFCLCYLFLPSFVVVIVVVVGYGRPIFPPSPLISLLVPLLAASSPSPAISPSLFPCRLYLCLPSPATHLYLSPASPLPLPLSSFPCLSCASPALPPAPLPSMELAARMTQNPGVCRIVLDHNARKCGEVVVASRPSATGIKDLSTLILYGTLRAC